MRPPLRMHLQCMHALPNFHSLIKTPFHCRGERRGDMDDGREALVVCGDRSTAVGITVRDVENADTLLRIPTCAVAAHGLICLGNRHLVASQVHKLGSIGSGSIFIWAMNRPHSPIRSYTMEAIGPLCSTRDGAYLAGGAASGNIYLWEVASGRLLKSWSAHHRSVKCMTFSDDGSFLISGSDDGMIFVWSVISLLDIEDSRGFSALLHCSSGHSSSVTGLLTLSSGACLNFISSSLDGTCKIWDLVSGRLIKTRVYEQAATAIALNPLGQLTFSGTVEGNIFVDAVDTAANHDPFFDNHDPSTVLKGHNESITALSFSKSGLISASRDCTVCLWNIESRVIIWRFNHQKGPVTNMVIIPRSSLFRQSYNPRGFDQNRVSSLEKYPQPLNSTNETVTLLHPVSCLRDDQTSIGFQRTRFLDKQLLVLEQENWTAAMEMKVERAMNGRAWAMNMTKHVVEMNKHIQSCLLDMMQMRLWPDEINSTAANNKRNKKKKIRVHQGLPIEREDQSQAQAVLP